MENSFLAHLGGAFIYSENPEPLVGWYAKMLGINWESVPDGSAWYISLSYNDIHSGKKAYAGLSIIRSKKKIVRSEGKHFMINYRIKDLEKLVAHLHSNNVEVKGIDDYPEGKFAWCKDPEGNELELWEDTTLN